MDWKGSLGTDRGRFDRLKEGCQEEYGMDSSREHEVALGVVDGRVAGCQNVKGWNLWRSRAQGPIHPYTHPFGDLG